MKINRNTKCVYSLIACAFFFIPLKLHAQTESVQPKFRQVIVYIPKVKAKKIPQKNNELVMDSLKNTILTCDSLYQYELLIAAKNDSLINNSNENLYRQKAVNNDLRKRISGYETLNLQTKKNNCILILFNSVVCLFLFAMLTRYLLHLRKKKPGLPRKEEPVPPAEIFKPDKLSQQTKTGRHLHQLERLGKLRNLGVLTEEEFIFQKQVILGNST